MGAQRLVLDGREKGRVVEQLHVRRVFLVRLPFLPDQFRHFVICPENWDRSSSSSSRGREGRGREGWFLGGFLLFLVRFGRFLFFLLPLGSGRGQELVGVWEFFVFLAFIKSRELLAGGFG
jgi:hypothetical protein